MQESWGCHYARLIKAANSATKSAQVCVSWPQVVIKWDKDWMYNWRWVEEWMSRETFDIFCSSWTSCCHGRCLSSRSFRVSLRPGGSQRVIPRASSHKLWAGFRVFVLQRGPVGKLSVNSLAVLTHSTARLGLSLYKERVCHICDIILISVRRGGTLPAPLPLPLRGPCFQSQRW